MADDSDLEKTEAPSPRRLEQARERGQVARSQELSTFVVLMAAGLGLIFLGESLMGQLSSVVRQGLALDRAAAFDPQFMIAQLYFLSFSAISALLPFFLLVIVAAILAPMALSGFLFSWQAMQPDFARLNPLSGIKRMFSTHGLVELLKAVAKSAIVGGIAFLVIWNNKEEVLVLAGEGLAQGVSHVGSLVMKTFLYVVGGLALIAAVDVPFQIWSFRRQLRMTREEVRQEMKEMEGDPQIKARIRALQREAARRRMMSEVPKADVIVTNPTHYAVALRYQASMRAPKVVAKGAGLVAERILALGREHRVAVLQAPPLARALYRHAEIEEEIPQGLYTAVAEVIAYIYQLRRFESGGGEKPHPPADLPVPPELDPANKAV